MLMIIPSIPWRYCKKDLIDEISFMYPFLWWLIQLIPNKQYEVTV